jgi:lipoate-protein ligase A
MEEARLILDAPASGAWNMAVDQALLETADRTGLITLRFYGWSEPTLSLGYFQSHHDRLLHEPSLECPLVRRRTGGGAILHDHEITYSLCIPSTNRWSSRNNDLYRSMHQIMIDLLGEYGVESMFHSDQSNLDSPDVGGVDDNQAKAFLCFQRRSDGDVVLDRHKIAGSAQRRLKNSLLQHGSILFRRSDFSPELPGIHDLTAFPLDESQVAKKLADEAEKRLHVRLFRGKLSKSEIEASERAFSSHFNIKDWNFRR